MIRYVCPACKREYESTTALAGLTVICLSCKHPIEIPSAASAAQETGIVERKISPIVASPKPAVPVEAPPPRLAQAVQPAINSPPVQRPDSLSAESRDLTGVHVPSIFQSRLPYARSVAAGLGLVALAAGLQVLANIVLWVSLVLMKTSLDEIGKGPWEHLDTVGLLRRLDTVRLLLHVGIVVGGVGLAIGLVGCYRCLAVGEETTSRQAIIGAVICESIGFAGALCLLAGLVFSIEALLSFVTSLHLGLELLSFLAHILFLLFLKKLADFLGEEALAGRARLLMFLGIAAGILSVSGVLQITFLLVVSVGVAVLWLGLYVSLVISLRRRLCESA